MTIKLALQLNKALMTINDASWELQKQFNKVRDELTVEKKHELENLLWNVLQKEASK